MSLTVALLLAAAVGTADTPPKASGAGEPKKEKMICKRDRATESRMGSKRICKTAEQWRAAEPVEGDVIPDDPRLRKM